MGTSTIVILSLIAASVLWSVLFGGRLPKPYNTRSSSAANLAMLLAVLGWLACLYGALSQMGDPAPNVSRAVIAAHQRMSNAVLLLGIFSLLSAIWLSGFAFLAAKCRAAIALAICILPLTLLFGYAIFRF